MGMKQHRGVGLWYAAAMLLVVVTAGGCAGSVADGEEEAHTLPEHHPRTVRRAVIDIGQRGAALTSGMLDASNRESQRRHLLDIVRWLPELAADTELGRRDWERVKDSAGDLARELESSAETDPRASGREAALSAALGAAMKTLVEAAALLPADMAPSEAPGDEKT